jgi:hypothetical protein
MLVRQLLPSPVHYSRPREAVNFCRRSVVLWHNEDGAPGIVTSAEIDCTVRSNAATVVLLIWSIACLVTNLLQLVLRLGVTSQII